MIGIDTNVLVRYLTEDDQAQALKASALIEQHAGERDSMFLNNIVLCELVWVLERGYKYNRNLITSAIRQLLLTEEFKFENLEVLWLSIDEYENTKMDFSDILIGRTNSHLYNCQGTITFDKLAAESEYFNLIN
jgi:predicted nucleic-acid-binding protein